MSAFERGDTDESHLIDRWENGVGWLAHPDESGRRASHAVQVDDDSEFQTESSQDGVLLLDPLDVPGVDGLIEELGTVVGVAILSGYHARDADVFAGRYDVPVYVPTWIDRAATRIDAPIERVDGRLAGFELHDLRPLRAWRETVAYRESDGTLYVPDFLTADSAFTVGPERVAMNTLCRFSPPPVPFEDRSPERLLFGHGEGVFDDPPGALRSGFEGARRRLPQALLQTFPRELQLMLSALR